MAKHSTGPAQNQQIAYFQSENVQNAIEKLLQVLNFVRKNVSLEQ